ncbi:MAG: hypothetical protein ACN6PV_02090 [Achromobacter sp.]|uniref:hypothetical protein n=1 Tax=Achromobacter sp. TaxID=134375 RepID=UPI003CFCA517
MGRKKNLGIILVSICLLSACSGIPKAQGPTPGLQTIIVNPGVKKPLLTSDLINDFSADGGSVLSTIYEIRDCRIDTECSLGVAKPEVSSNLIRQLPDGIEVSISVKYSVAANQVLELGGTTTRISVPGNVNHISESRLEQRQVSMRYGDAKRLDLGYGDSIIFCARRVPTAGAPEMDRCPVDLRNFGREEINATLSF